MKKIISLFLVVAIGFSLTACGIKDEQIRNALQGSWIANWTMLGKPLSRYYTFKGDTYTTGGVAVWGVVDKKTGIFEISNGTIKLIPDDGSDGGELDFTYNESSGEIILWWGDEIQFEKGTVSKNYSW